MRNKKVWLITGAGRGLGVHIAQAALVAGYAVIATGRNPDKVEVAVGAHPDMLAVRLDVTQPGDAHDAVAAAVERFGQIDVVVNNAGNFVAGFFEELTTQDIRDQLDTLLFGPMNVARAALPVMRKQRAGLLVTISSTAGIVGGVYCAAYAAAKFGLEGWIESLAPEIAPFGIRSMVVNPGFFRAELLTAGSTTYAASSIDDYAQRASETVSFFNGMDGSQGGDPAKLAQAVVQLAGQSDPPARFVAGADALQAVEAKANFLVTQANAYRDLSSSLGVDAAA